MPHKPNLFDRTLLGQRKGWEWSALRAQIIARDGGRCVVCGAQASDVDHIVPRNQGGTDDPSNLRTLCHRCHMSRARAKAATWNLPETAKMVSLPVARDSPYPPYRSHNHGTAGRSGGNGHSGGLTCPRCAATRRAMA